MAVLSIADLSEFVAIPEVFESEEWINLAVGAWLVVCPCMLRFDDDPLAMRTHLVVGLMVAAIAAIELWLIRHSPSPH